MTRFHWLVGLSACTWISETDLALRLDNDSDGVLRPHDCDDNDADVQSWTTWCEDVDRDGLGNPDAARAFCEAPADGSWSQKCSDCDDRDSSNLCVEPVESADTAEPCDGDPDVPFAASLTFSSLIGDVDATTFVATVSPVSGDPPFETTVDWGDPSQPGPELEHVYSEPGVFLVAATVSDACGRLATDTQTIVVAPLGERITATTGADESDDEVDPPSKAGYLGSGLSLREALTLASDQPGPQVVTIDPSVTELTLGPDIVAWDDHGGILVGHAGLTVRGDAGTYIDSRGNGAVIASMTFADFESSELGAIRLVGNDSVIQDVVVRDSLVATTVLGAGSALRGVRVTSNTRSGIRVRTDTLIEDVVIEDTPVGIRIFEGLARIEQAIIVDYGTAIAIEAGFMGEATVVDSTLIRGRRAIQHLGSHPGSLVLKNTILADHDQYGFDGNPEVFADGSPDHNLWWDNLLGDCRECTPGPHAVLLDPQLGGSLLAEPSATGPVVDTGTDTGTDRNGPFPGTFYGAAPDIGAIERLP